LLRPAIAATIASCTVTTATVRPTRNPRRHGPSRSSSYLFRPAARPTRSAASSPRGCNHRWVSRSIIENAPGATGSVRTGKVARAEADGHTLILGTIATHVFNGAAYPLKYDVVADFEPIALIAFDPQIIVVRKELPVADFAQLIAFASDARRISISVANIHCQ
jgi:Tripartite tricarboxylate transporter family receptor